MDIGVVKKGDSITVHLNVKNIGNVPLKIKNIGYSCGCTEGRLLKNNLVALESTDFVFTYKNESDINSFDKTIMFESNALEPFKILKIRGSGR